MTTIQHRQGSSEEWTSVNPILHSGEIGYEHTTSGPRRFKMGDGVTHWNDLPYSNAVGELTPEVVEAALPSRLSEESISTTITTSITDELSREGSPARDVILSLVGDGGGGSGEWNPEWDSHISQLVEAAVNASLGNVVRSDTVRNIVTSVNPDSVVLQEGDLLASLLPPDGA